MTHNNIITNRLSSLEFIELRDYMLTCLEESMSACDENAIAWYEACDLENYFYELQDVYENDRLIGSGIDAFNHFFVLNEETKEDFDEAFRQAKDTVCTY